VVFGTENDKHSGSSNTNLVSSYLKRNYLSRSILKFYHCFFLCMGWEKPWKIRQSSRCLSQDSNTAPPIWK